LVQVRDNMFGNSDKDEMILALYGQMPLKRLAKKSKCSINHVKYVLYKKNHKR
jgi:hypothetical protein